MPNIRTDKQPVTQIAIVESEPDKQAEALAVMTERARFMARQPGFVSISVHRSLDGRRLSTTSSGRTVICCRRRINHLNSARSGPASIN